MPEASNQVPRPPQSFAVWSPGDPEELKRLLRAIARETGEKHGFIVRRLLRAEAARLGVKP